MSGKHSVWMLWALSCGFAASTLAGTLNLSVARVVVVDNC